MRTLSNSIKAAAGLLLLAFLVVIAGFSSVSLNQRSQVDAKSLVKKTIDAFNNRTPELLNQIFATKITYHSQSETESSEATIRSIYDNNLATFPDFKFILEDVIAEGNKVLVRVIFQGTHKTSGKKVRFADHWIGRVEGGKFMEAWEVLDALTWNQQLGYTIAPPEQQASTNQAQVEAISKLREQEIAAFSAADVKTLLSIVTDDVVIMPPSEPAFTGKDALRAWAENIYKQFTVKGKYTSSNSSNIILAGDWAFERLAFTLTMTPLAGGEPIQEIGKGIHIYRRQADGAWKIAQDIWNTDNPPAAGH